MYYVYLLVSKIDQSWYIGETSNLKRRFSDHNKGLSRYTNQHKPYELVYYESYLDQKDAKGRERYLKSGAGRIKLKEQLKHYFIAFAPVAQWIEQDVSTVKVGGSNPSWGTIIIKNNKNQHRAVF